MGSLLWLPLEYLVLQQAISIYFLERRWEDSFSLGFNIFI